MALSVCYSAHKTFFSLTWLCCFQRGARLICCIKKQTRQQWLKCDRSQKKNALKWLGVQRVKKCKMDTSRSKCGVKFSINGYCKMPKYFHCIHQFVTRKLYPISGIIENYSEHFLPFLYMSGYRYPCQTQYPKKWRSTIKTALSEDTVTFPGSVCDLFRLHTV